MKGQITVFLLSLLIGQLLAININHDQIPFAKADKSVFPSYTVYVNSDNGFLVKEGKDTTGVAYAIFSNEMLTTGWGYLSVTTNSSYSDLTQAAGAGYLEGFITQEMIWQNWNNMYVNEYHQTIGDNVQAWIAKNIQYMDSQIKANPTDPYWTHINLIWTQLTSMVTGYNDANTDSSTTLQLLDFLLMNMDGDMIDLGPALNLSSSTQTSDFNPKVKFTEFMRKTGHCSALIKLADDLSDLYSAHVTWSSFYEMSRIFKVYNFGYKNPAASKITMFSSYPATLSSIDDFYLLDTKITVIETTNGLMNNNLYPLITPNSVLSWIRVIVANRMATDGNSWCQVFEKYNSGTYNNQWIIVDYNKFTPGVSVRDGTLFILEQIPGYCEYEDNTDILLAGYFGSYNIPRYEYIYNISGFNDTASYGNWFSYTASPRAEIFRRDANNVHTFQQMQAMIRYNNWAKDPLSLGNSGNQISSRFDLVTHPDPNNQYLDADAFGGIDGKVVNYQYVQNLMVSAQSGPTHDQVAPFDWNQDSGIWNAKYTHVGMPDHWNFGWATMNLESMDY